MYLAHLKFITNTPMKFYKLLQLSVLAFFLSLTSCKNDDGPSIIPPRDYAEQYGNEILEIEEYLATHYLEGEGLDATIIEIPENGEQTPLAQHPNLQFKIVNKHDIDYKLYYLKFNEGVNQRPSHVDSIFVSYRGWLMDGTQFDNTPNPIWLTLDGVIEGWTQVFPEFQTGIYNQVTDVFEGAGSGLMIIPSGLAYYNESRTNIIPYSTLIFSFNLNTLRYRDHDSDGIPSRFEVENLGDDPRKYDSDGDGIPNYLDKDDDNDGFLTIGEIKDAEGNILPFDEIPTCNGGSIKKHLDPSCH